MWDKVWDTVKDNDDKKIMPGVLSDSWANTAGNTCGDSPRDIVWDKLWDIQTGLGIRDVTVLEDKLVIRLVMMGYLLKMAEAVTMSQKGHVVTCVEYSKGH